MSTVTLTVQRATQSIGGRCIEIVTGDGGRLILDMVRPLGTPHDATGMLPATLDLAAPVDGLPAEWPFW